MNRMNELMNGYTHMKSFFFKKKIYIPTNLFELIRKFGD